MSHPALLEAQWPAPPGVRALTTLRYGAGISKAPFDRLNLGNARAADGDASAAVARNRAELVRLAELPSAPFWLRQVHGTDVSRIRPAVAEDAIADEPEADASVTDVPGAVLAVLTADCLPAVLASKDGSEVAAAHAGWRGLADGVLETTVAAMATSPGDLQVWLGPAAGPQRYEIGQAVFDAFMSKDAGAQAAFVPTRPGHWRVDLYSLARMRLQKVGVSADAIHGGDLCTISDPSRFFSHRRDARTGRMATLVWMQSAAAD